MNTSEATRCVVHGHWSDAVGLFLWTAPMPADHPVPPGWELPTALVSALSRPRRYRALVATPSGVPVDMPGVALSPPTAVGVLAAVDPADPLIGGDLAFLAHLCRGVERWIRNGEVAPQLTFVEGECWPRWRLLGTARQRSWMAEMSAAAPPVLTLGSGQEAWQVVAATVEGLTDALTRRVLAQRAGPPGSSHPLVAALLADSPFDSPQVGKVADLLERWRLSAEAEEVALVLMLEEPPTPEFGSLSDQDNDLPWTLRVCLRWEGEAPVPVSTRGADVTAVQTAMTMLGVAMAAYPLLRELPNAPSSLDLLLPTEVVTDLVQHGARALADAGVTLLLPRAWNLAPPTLRLTVTTPAVAAEESAVGMAQIVDFDWELALGEMTLTAAEMAALAHTKSGLVRLRGAWVHADHAALAKAVRFVRQHHGGRGSLGALLALLTAADAPPVPVTEVAATGWVSALLGGDRERRLPDTPVPPGLRAELRHYQHTGLRWLSMMSTLGLGAVLADDMGLGKTVQLLALLLHELPRVPAPTLLVCPMSLVGNWQREAERFAPQLRVLVHHGAERHHAGPLSAQAAASDLVITTYTLLAKDLAHLQEITWERVVLDEAQHIKNAATKQARAARALEARHRVALSGTPVENRLEELRSLLDFTNPGLLGSAQTFRARFAVPIEREHNEAAAARLRSVTGPFVLRRLKTDPKVIADLPEKLEMTVRANLTEEQTALYQAVVDDMLEKINQAEGMARKGAVLAALTRLKQVCNHPAHYLGDGSGALRRGRHRSGKLALVEDVLDSVLAEGERALLFTQFREFGDLVGPFLAARFGVEVPFLHGGVSKRGRDEMVAAFQSGHGPPIMLLSLKAGGTGLNLTAANHVIHLDRWWNPAVENQATDRAFRIGQTRAVQVRKLVCVGTVEERIDTMLAGKRDLADKVVGHGENWITEMGTDELRQLLRLGADATSE